MFKLTDLDSSAVAELVLRQVWCNACDSARASPRTTAFKIQTDESTLAILEPSAEYEIVPRSSQAEPVAAAAAATAYEAFSESISIVSPFKQETHASGVSCTLSNILVPDAAASDLKWFQAPEELKDVKIEWLKPEPGSVVSEQEIEVHVSIQNFDFLSAESGISRITGYAALMVGYQQVCLASLE